MKLVLVSHPLCPFVHRSAIMLTEKGLPFELRYVDLKNKPDWFVSISPRGKVPILVADEQPLFESSVINEFLDETHPPPILPRDPWERARQRAWVEVANDLLATQFAAFAAQASEVEPARAKLDSVLRRFEEAIATGAIDDAAFGLVQIAVAPALHRFVAVEPYLETRFLEQTPRLESFARHVAARPSVASTVPNDFTERFLDIFVARGSGIIPAASAKAASARRTG